MVNVAGIKLSQPEAHRWFNSPSGYSDTNHAAGFHSATRQSSDSFYCSADVKKGFDDQEPRPPIRVSAQITLTIIHRDFQWLCKTCHTWHHGIIQVDAHVLHKHGLTLIPSSVSNCVVSKWYYLSIPKQQGCIVEVWEWIDYFTPHALMYVCVYMLGLKLIHVSKRSPRDVKGIVVIWS